VSGGGFVKLYGSILDSSVWSEDPHTRLVWITMLAMADAEGFIEAAVPGLARRANVPIDACERALERLAAPDPYSKTPANDGCRIEKVDRGWIVLNYKQYRELRTPEQVAAAERQARYKLRKTSVSADVSHSEKTPALLSASVHTTTEGGVTGDVTVSPERAAELSEAAACEATCREYAALTGKALDEVLFDFSEFKNRRLMRFDPVPPAWLRVTHDRVKAALIEERRKRQPQAQPAGEEPLARIKRLEREGAAARKAQA
jgi:hypothetical protein